MNWLFWKEYRQNRPVIIALLAMLIIPYLFALWATWEDMHRPHPIGNALQNNLARASFLSVAISQVALALIGGNVICGERADRSAEFQAYLPITRRKILAGKLLLSLAIAAVIWLAIPSIGLGLLFSVGIGRIPPQDVSVLSRAIANTAITGMMFFCVAWLFSSFLSSPTYSTVAGLVTPFLIASLIAYVNYLIQGDQWAPRTGDILQICYWSISLTVAPLCFILGTWLYLRRVEP